MMASRRWHSHFAPLFNNISFVRHKSTTGIKWLWRANEVIKEFDRANANGTRMGILVTTLCSAKPLEESHFIEAVRHLHRKSAHLKVCFRNCGDELWLCQPSKLEADFQILGADSITTEVMLGMVKEGFCNPNTPPFRFRVIPRQKDAIDITPEIKESHPYQYDLFLHGHHGIMDGLGVSILLQHILKLLNDVTIGIHIDEEEYSPLYEDKEIPALLSGIQEQLRQDWFFAENISKTHPHVNNVPLFFQAFPRPQVSEVTTKHITTVIAPRIFTKFYSMCKREGVTFNSAFIGVINAALMQLIKKSGIQLDSYRISASIVTSLRRYRKPSPVVYYGPCATNMSYTSSVNRDAKEDFWAYCRRVHEELQNSLNQGLPLQQKALQMMTDAVQPPIDYVTRLRPALHDYSMTNLGDITASLSGCGNFVKPIYVTTMNMIHNSFNSSLHEIMSFNDTCYHTLAYATNYFSDETANLVSKEILSLLEDLTKI